MSDITYQNGVLVVRTPYNPNLVSELKAVIPAGDRRWNKEAKAWEVAPEHGASVQDMIARHCGELVSLPAIKKATLTREQRILDVRYLGQTKDRGNGERTAFAWVDNGWNVIFQEKALRDWFSDEAKPGDEKTLYAILGIGQKAQDEEIKKAYRRMARQWHPDVCKEPDAKEQFIKIQHAYELLSDPRSRARYDAGLKLTASTQGQGSKRGQRFNYASIGSGYAPVPSFDPEAYRSPLRCGFLIVEGVERLGRFVVDKIVQWEDITNSRGQTLVTSWPMGAERPVESWS